MSSVQDEACPSLLLVIKTDSVAETLQLKKTQDNKQCPELYSCYPYFWYAFILLLNCRASLTQWIAKLGSNFSSTGVFNYLGHCVSCHSKMEIR